MCYYFSFTCTHIFMVEKIILLYNATILKEKLVKYYLEESKILTLLFLVSVQHFSDVGKLILVIKQKIRKMKLIESINNMF